MITTSQPDLAAALKAVKPVIPKRPLTPIVGGVLFAFDGETLTLSASGPEVRLDTRIPAEGLPTSFVLLFDDIEPLVKRQPKEARVSFDFDGERVRVKAKNRATLIPFTAEDFPQPDAMGAEPVAFDGALLQAVHDAAPFVSKDALRPAMNGVLLDPKGDTTNVVATDGHRLFRRATDIPALGSPVVIPQAALDSIPTEGEVLVAITDRKVCIENESITVTATLITETFPNYEAVIPTEHNKTLRIDREAFQMAVRRALLSASTMTSQVALTLNGSCLIEAEDIERSKKSREEIEADYEGDELRIGFNGTYVDEMIDALTDDAVWHFSSPNRAARIEDGPTTLILMPVQLNTYS